MRMLLSDLKEICETDRHVGSPGNLKATKYVAGRFESLGFGVTQSTFNCIDWEYGECELALKSGRRLKAFVSPYSLPCQLTCSLETASTIEELETKAFKGKIAVLFGDLCKEQIMPKGFVFYNPEEHQKIGRILEEKAPSAIVAITTKNPELAGAWYPFPLFEDGDFDIPSVYMTEEEGHAILNAPHESLSLVINSRRIPSTSSNVVATKKGTNKKKIAICAHIDTKKGTPGALDNGTGVAILLSLASRFTNYSGKYTLEFVAFNGEDYYSAPGQMLYLSENPSLGDDVALAINIDGAGYKGSKNSFTTLDCPEDITTTAAKVFDHKNFVEIDPWHQGDHMIFVMNQVPAIAISSENPFEVAAKIAHTEKDTFDKVDVGNLEHIVDGLGELIERML